MGRISGRGVNRSRMFAYLSALGVEVVKRVPSQVRGTALAVTPRFRISPSASPGRWRECGDHVWLLFGISCRGDLCGAGIIVTILSFRRG